MNCTIDDPNNQQSTKELPNENIEHDSQPEKAVFEEKNKQNYAYKQ